MNHPPSTDPPSIRFAAPGGDAPTNEFTKQENLGIREIAGVPAHGIREAQTIKDDKDGKEVMITDEYWYSQDLRINLMIKHSDPRKETTTLTVDQATREEPDPTLFEVPKVTRTPNRSSSQNELTMGMCCRCPLQDSGLCDVEWACHTRC